MPGSKDYYELLEVKRDASAEEIRRAYRRLARTYHPDVNKSPDAATRFSAIQEAYDVLSDAEKRKAYDRFGHAGVGVGAGPGGFAAGAPGGGWTWSQVGPGGQGGGFGGSDFASVIEEMFGGRAGSPFGPSPPRGAGPGRPPSRRGQEVAQALTVSFLTAARGGQERIRLTSGTSGGGGGRGGVEQAIHVKIPPGIESGAKLRLKGKGAPAPGTPAPGMPDAAGGGPGDLILTVRVGEHPYFRREGLDLLIDVPLTLAEAALGATVTVPLLAGTVEIKVPRGTASGRRLRVKGKGIADAKGSRGDFYAVVQIVPPEALNDRARRLLGDLAPELKNPRDSAPWAADVRDQTG
ncbi:MAG: DnaJ C-terminal domain-containing protein [Planctomycetota bacterium]|jgi:curved DNA-binding protein